ncbi:MAG: sensor histidine kinase [Bacteroidetes bacterium]|nr:MAG: sensor histidine kinase [Bacteroidota bacterium]
MPRRTTLTWKLAWALIGTILGVLLLVGLGFYALSRLQHERELVTRANLYSRELPDLLAEPLWIIDYEGVAQIARIYAARPEIAYLRVDDERGQVLFEHRAAGTDTTDGIRRSMPVLHQDQPVGRITMVFSTVPMRAENRAMLRLLLVAGLLLIVFVTVLVIGLIRRVVQRPLTRLIDDLHRIEEGDYDRRLPATGVADLDAIVAAVNAMVAAIRERDARLRRLNEELEERVARRTADLQRKNEELERFVAVVSHDLKTPLTSVMGFLALLRNDVTSGRMDTFDDYTGRMQRALTRMQRLLDDLLELARSGQLPEKLEAVPLHEPLQEALEQAAAPLQERGVTVDVPPVLPVVRGDRHRLAEVFQNLLVNAAKYMGDQPAPRVVVRATEQNGRVHCTVCDNGMGIPKEAQEKVFELFSRLETGVEGTGVGLAVVKRIVELHGGRVWIESEGPGRGTCFHLELPACAEDAHPGRIAPDPMAASTERDAGRG